MSKEKSNNNNEKKDPAIKPDPKTKNTTDPQENMEGPLSSIMQNIKDEAEEEDDDKKDAPKK